MNYHTLPYHPKISAEIIRGFGGKKKGKARPKPKKGAGIWDFVKSAGKFFADNKLLSKGSQLAFGDNSNITKGLKFFGLAKKKRRVGARKQKAIKV